MAGSGDHPPLNGAPMRIVINHLTRMRGGYICAAGVDLETERHVRPVLDDGALPFDLLARYGGAIEMANVVDLGSARPVGKRPHVEDHVIVPGRLRLCGQFPPDDFLRLQNRLSRVRLSDLFGPQLKPVGRCSCGTEIGEGEASLGCFRPERTPYLYCTAKRRSGKPSIRMKIDDGRFVVVVGVTDIRLYEDDHCTPHRERIGRAAARILDSTPVVLSLGLTRAFAAAGSSRVEPAHWLQVNNIHFEDEPLLWHLG